MISVLLGELGGMLRLGLRELLQDDARLTVQESRIPDLRAALDAVHPEVVVLDLDDAASDTVARTIAAQYPEVRVLACSSMRAVMRVYPPPHREPYTTALDSTSLVDAVTGRAPAKEAT